MAVIGEGDCFWRRGALAALRAAIAAGAPRLRNSEGKGLSFGADFAEEHDRGKRGKRREGGERAVEIGGLVALRAVFQAVGETLVEERQVRAGGQQRLVQSEDLAPHLGQIVREA